jgi:uncharacterized protein YjiS (DUF1127 family)
MTSIAQQLSRGLNLPRLVAHALIRSIRNAAADFRLRRTVRRLEQLDDHTLKDIGVSRSEIASAVRRGIRQEF